jgi:hypothetical protein
MKWWKMAETDRPRTRVVFTIGADAIEVESNNFEHLRYFVYLWIGARRTGLTVEQEDKFQTGLSAALARLEKAAE